MHTTTQLAADAIRHGNHHARIAHAALFERIAERIHRYFRRMLPDPHAVDDCLQRTLTLLEQSLHDQRYDPSRSFNTWMWLKARTVFAQWCRERDRAPLPLPPHPPDPRSDPAHTEQLLDADTLLQAVHQRLGLPTYEAFVLYYEGGLTQAEVAEALQTDRKTIRNHITAAHALIDRLLD